MNDTLLARLLGRGGVYYSVPGDGAKSVLRAVMDVAELPASVDRDELYRVLVEREELNSTAVGRGIAFPHPRNPIVRDEPCESVSVFFPTKPVEYGALDRTPVRVLFLILSSSPKNHLAALSRLSYLCRTEEFGILLARLPAHRELLDYVAAREREWEKA
ncbi:MAG: PTS sugar transporter subunit IIA [Spirochaetes bacterium]|nr:PTS sugar transporter subunit IIA [Spirochaetota bacterium]